MVTKSDVVANELIKNFQVHRRIYTDANVFQAEIERIFERTWVYVGHETEISELGDYKTSHIGQQPVIVTRGVDDGQIHVLFNTCRHRGVTVCQSKYGNSGFFRCAYHGWTYSNHGELIGVPFRSRYGPEFEVGEFGLLDVPRVGNFGGFIFASLSPDGPTLDEHLGDAGPYLQKFAADGPEPIEVKSGVQRYTYKANWKFAAENVIDNYHPSFAHAGWLKILQRRAGRKVMLSGDPNMRLKYLGNGHVVLEIGADPLHDPYNQFNMVIFPNLAFLGRQIRPIRPIAVDQTEILFFPTQRKGVPEEMNKDRMWRYMEIHGPAGLAVPDDIEMYERMQEGMKVKDNEWLLFSRGYDAQDSTRTGVIEAPHATDELGMRGYYGQWSKLMTSSS
jgi:phenylpropionate dioxygenase-like ring-hydroxylating dioxygenase large terminal subunit